MEQVVKEQALKELIEAVADAYLALKYVDTQEAIRWMVKWGYLAEGDDKGVWNDRGGKA